jgi:hypothetical protein
MTTKHQSSAHRHDTIDTAIRSVERHLRGLERWDGTREREEREEPQDYPRQRKNITLIVEHLWNIGLLRGTFWTDDRKETLKLVYDAWGAKNFDDLRERMKATLRKE